MIKRDINTRCGVFDSRAVYRNSLSTESRICETYEIELFCEDGGTSYIDGVAHEVRRGMMLCCPAGTVRHSRLHVKCYYLKLSPASPEAELLSRIIGVRYMEGEELDRLAMLFFRFISVYLSSRDDSLANLRLTGIFYEMLYVIEKGEMAPDSSRIASLSLSSVIQIKEYLDKNYKGKCTLAGIAARVNLSPNYLQTIFRRAMGVTPLEYVTRRRISEAKRMIAMESLSFSEISAELGFSSQSHFNKVFLERVGVTPNEYRRQLAESY